jgi:[acyl-carrier-protein] S-malonyltransferase
MSLGFVFPGQGSQSVGMVSALSQAFPSVKATFDEGSEVLGYDLWDLVENGPEQELNKTDKTPPAMLAAAVAVWRIWQDKGLPQPSLLAGHSLGEYSALTCAGSIGYADALRLVSQRGRFMQEAAPQGKGAMAAILGLDDELVIEVCNSAAQGQIVSAVNFNSPGQVVVAGETDAVNRAVVLAQEAGAKRALILPVSVPSHCALMKPAADKLAETLNGIEISPPSIPVLHNVSVSSTQNVNEIRSLLVKQLYNPVRWVETIQQFAASGITQIIECGPGKVLTGLNKRIDKNLSTLPVYDAATLEKASMDLN